MATAPVTEQVFDTLRAPHSLNTILSDLPTSRSDPDNYLDSISSATQEFITAWKEKADK
jgi:hypothetical protein